MLSFARYHQAMTATAPRTARDRARAEITGEIKAVARRQLAEQGSAALSLRAVAREGGPVSAPGVPPLPEPRRSAHRTHRRRVQRGRRGRGAGAGDASARGPRIPVG